MKIDIYKYYGEKIRESEEKSYEWLKKFYIDIFGRKRGLKLLAKSIKN